MNAIPSRNFKGTVISASPEYHGLEAPATLTLADHGGTYECIFIFVAGEPLTLTVIAPKTTGNTFHGTADDPRGWKVAFEAELDGKCVTGTYQQPHDHGSFVLNEI